MKTPGLSWTNLPFWHSLCLIKLAKRRRCLRFSPSPFPIFQIAQEKVMLKIVITVTRTDWERPLGRTFGHGAGFAVVELDDVKAAISSICRNALKPSGGAGSG
jgi:hypothetical protein